MKKCKRFLALLLVLCMMLSVVPFSAFASEGSDETTDGGSQNATVETVAEETTAEETTGETTVEETTDETTVEETTEATTEDTVAEEEDETREGGIASFALTREAAGYALTMGTKPADGTTTGNPFKQGTGGSNSFRIPAMVTLSDGTIVAAADARWNTTYDGGGLDTIVSYSTDNGANWNYTFANYLGDNGNTYNGSGSTAFIDPALATDGSTVYMLCDLYPYGVALNGSGNTAPSTAVGFNSDGTLKLAKNDSSSYDYYLKDGQIYDSSDNVVSGYTVDAYFNITGTDGTSSNLFFSDSPYQVVRTGYLYLTTSSDGGKTWSGPTLIPNVKTSSEQVCLVGPGRGLVTGGKIIFPVYSYNGSSSSQQMGFIYSSDGGATWTRSANFTGASWSSEAAVVALSDGTLRFFYRNGTSALCYVDYSWTNGWGSAVSTGIATNSNTQISAISYSKTVDGKQVILVSCPTGSNNAGSSSSSASARLNGRIQIGFVDSSDNTMSWGTPIDVTTDNNQFMYSCLTELNNGKVAILYEDYESAWGDGYYTMSFKTFDLGLTFDTEQNDNIYVDDVEGGTGIQINFGTTNVADNSVTITRANPDVLSGKTYVAYDIAVTDFSGSSATVIIPLNGAFADDATLYAVYINDSGAIAEEIQGVRDTAADTFTFTATHFSTYAVVADESSDTPEYEYTQDITLTVGEVRPVTDNTGNYESSYTGEGLNTSIATVNVSGTDGEDSPTNEWQLVTNGVSGINTTDKYLIVSGNSGSAYALTSSGGATSVTITDGVISTESVASDSNAVFTFAGSGNSWAINGTTGYLYPTATRSWGSWSYNLSTGNTSSQTVAISGTSGVTISRSVTSGWNTTTSYLTLDRTAGASNSSDTVYLFKLVEKTNKTDPYTTITFTGVSAGKTSVVVGDTLYNITVNRKTENVNVIVDGTATYTDSSSNVTVADSTVASATLSNGTLTITGLKDGTTKVTTDTTVYTVTVSDGTPISIQENTTETISVTLEDGQTVEWSSADSNYVGVAGKYDTTAGAYTNAAILAGQNVTSSPVTVTATIKDADGNVVGTQKWLVTVTAGDADTNTSSKGIYFNISTIENCTVYYSINGGELIPINGTGVSTGEWTGNGTYTGRFNIMFFAAPDDGYALTYMYIEGTDGQYYTLANGSNPDGTDSDAWPFIDPARDTIPTSNSDATIWKTVNGSLHGFRWALLEGNMTIERMKVLFSNAIALGCDGVTTQTKNSTDGIGSASDPMEVKFVAQKLPTVEKTITSITRGSETIPYTEGMKVKIGDTINYSVVVTRYATNATYGTITYDNEKLTDELTNDAGISNPDMGTSTTSDKAYTYTTSLTLTNENFGTVVKRGAITNEVKFSYTYSSQYSAGSMNAKASAVAEVTVDIPSYVVDFGLPVEIDLLENGNNDGKIISCSNGLYGSAKVNDAGTGFTYTLDQVMQDVDYIEFTYILNNAPDYEYTYTVAIYPATTVYYEEGFAAYTGTWTGNASKGSGTQATRIAGSNEDEYGYDQKYAHENAGPSNGTQATSSAKGDKAEFAFTGTGVDIYANCTPQTGWLMIHVKNGDGNTVKVVTVKLLQVNTALQNGGSSATTGQAVNGYNVPVASITGLSHGNYTVTITNISTEEGKTTVNLDGFRIYGTLATEPDFYQTDEEDKPTFIELRDQVLAGLSVTYTGSDQVYAGGEIPDGAQVAVVASSAKYTQANVDDLLKNGPKNEIYLQPGQALVLKITTAREVQIGLKALNAATTYTITGKTGDQSISTSTDLFYTVLNKNTSGQQTITITNNGEGILSVTKLKVCDDPNAALAPLTWEDLATALSDLRIGGDPSGSETTDPTDPPVDPEEPEVTYADATLSVSLVDYAGKQIASVDLIDNGVAGETKAFTAEEVLAAAKANVPEGYVLVDESKVTGAEVVYGESGKVTVQIDKTATLNVIYVNLRGKNVGTATITKVQTSAGSCQFSASQIRANAPAGRRAVWLTSVKVPYGSDRTIIVPVF